MTGPFVGIVYDGEQVRVMVHDGAKLSQIIIDEVVLHKVVRDGVEILGQLMNKRHDAGDAR